VDIHRQLIVFFESITKQYLQFKNDETGFTYANLLVRIPDHTASDYRKIKTC